MDKPKRFRVTIETRGGKIVYLRKTENGFTTKPEMGKLWMNAGHVEAAKRWARRRPLRFKLGSVKGHLEGTQPYIQLASGVVAGNKPLMKRANAVGERLNRPVRVISGWRTDRQAWELRMLYNAGKGNLAAPCCSKYGYSREWHSWESCGKDPWSNHADGKALDCGIVDKHGNYTSIGNYPGARVAIRANGLCLPVPGEAWHLEIGNTWRA